MIHQTQPIENNQTLEENALKEAVTQCLTIEKVDYELRGREQAYSTLVSHLSEALRRVEQPGETREQLLEDLSCLDAKGKEQWFAERSGSGSPEGFRKFWDRAVREYQRVV